MKGIEINLNTLPPNTSNRHLQKAKHFAFSFKEASMRFMKRRKNRKRTIDDIGERPTPFMEIMSFVCIGIAFVFAMIEASNVKTSIMGAMNISDFFAFVIGTMFAASGLVAGEMLGSKKSWKHDGFSGRKKPTSKFFIGLAFALTYLFGQYWLASRAGNNLEDVQDTVTTLTVFVMFIALAELLFGMAFLQTAIKVFTVFIANIKIRLSFRKMKRTSKVTDEAWRHYVYVCGENSIEPEPEPPAVADARRFYNSGELSADLLDINLN